MTYSTNVADKLRDLALELEDLADGMTTDANGVDVSVAVNELVGRARISVSQAASGEWWAYVIMPDNFVPAQTRGWIHNDYQGHYWFDRSGRTREEAMRKAIAELLDKDLSTADG